MIYMRSSEISVFFFLFHILLHIFGCPSHNLFSLGRTLVAQWIKRWPADLAVPSSNPARDEISSAVSGSLELHTTFHYQPLMVLI